LFQIVFLYPDRKETDPVDGRKLRGDQRRQELMTAGLSLVATEGIEAVTHRAVAKACGVSVASVTYHYPTVSELKSGIFGCAGDRALAAVELAATSDAQGGDVTGLAGEFARRFCREERDLTSTLLQLLTAAGRDETLRPVADRLSRRAENTLAAVVGADAAPLIVAAIQGILLRALSLGEAGPDWARDATHTLISAFAVNRKTES
jgi:DNA-binding transcriptional regulator YbjK